MWHVRISQDAPHSAIPRPRETERAQALAALDSFNPRVLDGRGASSSSGGSRNRSNGDRDHGSGSRDHSTGSTLPSKHILFLQLTHMTNFRKVFTFPTSTQEPTSTICALPLVHTVDDIIYATTVAKTVGAIMEE